MPDLVAYSIIIDDLVFPDGHTVMGVLGGSGPQTAFGMKLWMDDVGLVGGIGHDFPAEALAWLVAMEIDLTGVRRYEEYTTLRAWQIFEEDGRRTQVWRSQGQAIPDQLALHFEHLPPAYRITQGFHYGVHPEHPNLAVAHALQANGVWVGIEPFKHAGHRLADTELQALCSAGQIFSPNLYEVESMVGPGAPHQQLDRLTAAGAQIVALRLGAEGSLVRRADTGESWHIPAVPTAVVDPCGAGNAYCGGFLAGWVQTRDLQVAGLYGAVSASFLVEQIGLPPANLAAQRAEAQLRLSHLRRLARRLV